ncbi:MAG: inositol monophosphatase [Planctomycetaceae bacterium]|jgi:myo-inositol-1(or 4)-monophosphatase|nr:inositol monophosphatase [Planctomycetaceae bacterium]
MSSYLTVCELAARSAGEILRTMFGKIHVRHKKNRFDLVTEADVAAQKVIEQTIFEHFPQHRFLGEETTAGLFNTPNVKIPNLKTPNESTKSTTDKSGHCQSNDSQSGDSQYCWIVDPLDGTTNYVHGLPLFCTSIALLCEDRVICAVIYNPMMEEFYSAEKGQGVFLNGEPIHVSLRETLEESLVSVSFPTMTQANDPDLRTFLQAVTVCQAIRRTGSTALNLAFVAAGRLDASWSFQCHPWDMSAGSLLVEEAGGVVTQPNGSPITFDDPSPVCAVANKTLHTELMKLINNNT